MTRETFWKGSRWSGHSRVRIVCNECEALLGDGPEGSDEVERIAKQCRDQNWGHECTRCREARESAYDMWVLNRPMGGE